MELQMTVSILCIQSLGTYIRKSEIKLDSGVVYYNA